jgi:hypothetical protein
MSSLGLVVPYFNPLRDKYRKANTRSFLSYLTRFPSVKFVLVEAAYDESLMLREEITEYMKCYDSMITYASFFVSSTFFRKENLINIGEKLLPEVCDCIGWIDSDIFFTEDDWPYVILDSLKTYEAVQVFKDANLLSRFGPTEATVTSVAYEWKNGNDKPQLNHLLPGHTGLGWAMHRKLFRAIGGLSEYAIVGGGDTELACALFDRLFRLQDLKSPAHWKELNEWAVGLNNVDAGFAPLTANHMWHGDEDKRQYYSRNQILINAEYNPLLDTKRNGLLLELSKKGWRMQGDILRYLSDRI